MSGRGTTQKIVTEHEITLERAMVTRHYIMTWDLDRCVGCQIGPLVCPKEAIIHVEGEIVDGRLAKKPSVDIDPEKCVLCGICEVMCPKNAITMTINGERENPVLVCGAFPDLIQSTTFDKGRFDWSRKEFVIDNCPTDVISHDEEQDTLVVDDEHCIRCRQCEIASDGAFHVVQPWQGQVELRREKCVEGCLACADICPTRALHIDDPSTGSGQGEGELVLADYYCIKCGAPLKEGIRRTYRRDEKDEKEERIEKEEKDQRDEKHEKSEGDARTWGLLIGLLILASGLISLAEDWWGYTWDNLWPYMVILVAYSSSTTALKPGNDPHDPRTLTLIRRRRRSPGPPYSPCTCT